MLCFYSFTCFPKVYEASSQHSQQQRRGSLEDLRMCLSKSDSIKQRRPGLLLDQQRQKTSSSHWIVDLWRQQSWQAKTWYQQSSKAIYIHHSLYKEYFLVRRSRILPVWNHNTGFFITNNSFGNNRRPILRSVTFFLKFLLKFLIQNCCLTWTLNRHLCLVGSPSLFVHNKFIYTWYVFTRHFSMWALFYYICCSPTFRVSVKVYFLLCCTKFDFTKSNFSKLFILKLYPLS